MKVHITTEPKLIAKLQEEGITQKEIADFENKLRQEFETKGDLIFNDLLRTSSLVDLDVRLCEQYNNNPFNYSAAFFSDLSSPDYLVFRIYEDYIRLLIRFSEYADLSNTILHELIHAADFHKLRDSYSVLTDMINDVNRYYMLLSHIDVHHPYQYLFLTLYLMSKYRSEGLAILGSSILTNQIALDKSQSINSCLNSFQSEVIANLYSPAYRPNIDQQKQQMKIVYKLAATVLYHVLETRGELEKTTLDKIQKGMVSGEYNLTLKEIQDFFTKCLNLSLTEFLAGLVTDNENGISLLPVKELLTFCANVSLDDSTNDMDTFSAMIEQNDNETIDKLNTILQSILDLTLTPKEIKKRYRDYTCSMDVEKSPLKPKIDKLYKEYERLNPGIIRKLFNWGKDDDSSAESLENEKKIELIGWTLTYFFNEEDLIKDTTPVYGYLDDMLVIDRAMQYLFDESNGQA